MWVNQRQIWLILVTTSCLCLLRTLGQHMAYLGVWQMTQCKLLYNSIHSMPHWRHNHWVTACFVSFSSHTQACPTGAHHTLNLPYQPVDRLLPHASAQQASHVLTTLHTWRISIIDCSCYRRQGSQRHGRPSKRRIFWARCHKSLADFLQSVCSLLSGCCSSLAQFCC